MRLGAETIVEARSPAHRSREALDHRYASLDGLRAVCILAMMLYHALYFLGGRLPVEEFRRLVHTFWAAPIVQLHFSMDAFFVLSGILIGRILFLETDGEGPRRLRFCLRRAFRILPAYWVALAVWGVFFAGEFVGLWANLLLINNWLPPEPIFMPWSWSLAVEEQFYLAAPLLIPWIARRRRPGLWLGLLLLPAVAYEFWRLHAAGVNALPEAHPALGAREFWAYYSAVYTQTLSRYFGIALGVGGAWLLVRGHLERWFGSYPRRAAFVSMLGVGIAAAQIFGGQVLSARDAPWAFAYALSYRWIFCLAVALAVLPTLVGPPRRLLLGRVLGRAEWRPAADLSYALYLFHPMVLVVLYSAYPKPLRSDAFAYLIYVAILLGVTFLIASLSSRFLELPLRRWGRRLSERF